MTPVERSQVEKPRRVIAIASAGGHWQQLMLMRSAFETARVVYVTTLPGLADQYALKDARLVPDCNRNTPVAAMVCIRRIVGIMARNRPQLVVSTGALPGVIALAVGRMFGARTIWIDSIANAEQMSQSGRLAKRFAHVWLSQWEHVARAEGAQFEGAVL